MPNQFPPSYTVRIKGQVQLPPLGYTEMDFSLESSNPNPNFTIFPENVDPMTELEFYDYLVLDDGAFKEDTSSQSMASPEMGMGEANTEISGASATSSCRIIKCKNGVRKNKSDLGNRVAFRMKSELEVMDDGYKWRKYGKKTVKNTPYPRNYYKCLSSGCEVKKRIERDRDDKSYVITTYDGVHNHESPYNVYYHQMPLMASNNAWTLQTSSSST